MALHWILGNGQYRQFVANRVKKIQDHPQIQWRHVPTSENPADLASRGGPVTNSKLWWSGLEWLRDHNRWPKNPVVEKSQDSEAEAKVIKEVLGLAQQQPDQPGDEFEQLLEHHDLHRALRVQAWMRRFTTNRDRKGPLTSEDLLETRNWWIKRVQAKDSRKPHFTQINGRSTSSRMQMESSNATEEF